MVRGQTPKGVPPSTPKSGRAYPAASSLKARSWASVSPRPPYSAGNEMPAYPPSWSRRWSARCEAMPSTVLWSTPRRRRPLDFGSRRSRLAASHSRASRRNVSMSVTAVSSQSGEMADTLAVPRRLPVERGVSGQAAQEQVLVVLPRVADATEHLEAVLGHVDAAVADERLGHAGHRGGVGLVGTDPARRRQPDGLAHL